MNSITFSIPLPPKELGQNSRGHWSKKSRATKLYRSIVHKLTLAAMPPGVPERWRKASVKVVAYYPTKRHPDPLNILDRLKAAFDGVQDSGLIMDDKGLWPERPEIYKDANNPRIELTITEEV